MQPHHAPPKVTHAAETLFTTRPVQTTITVTRPLRSDAARSRARHGGTRRRGESGRGSQRSSTTPASWRAATRIFELRQLALPPWAHVERDSHERDEKDLRERRVRGGGNNRIAFENAYPAQDRLRHDERDRDPAQALGQRASVPAVIHTARMSVMIETIPAITRCEYSKRMPPTKGGISRWYARGQSGTESPASLFVTSAPAISSSTVKDAVVTAKRYRPRDVGVEFGAISPVRSCLVSPIAVEDSHSMHRAPKTQNFLAGPSRQNLKGLTAPFVPRGRETQRAQRSKNMSERGGRESKEGCAEWFSTALFRGG